MLSLKFYIFKLQSHLSVTVEYYIRISTFSGWSWKLPGDCSMRSLQWLFFLLGFPRSWSTGN